MRYLPPFILLISVLLWSSCRKDFETVPSTGNLDFSKDTVYLDTVFSGIGSSTYNLTVHNTSNEDISISNIQLADGNNSYYRLNVDGIPGKNFEDIDILAHDNIYIFVEITASIQNLVQNKTKFLYTDAILFDRGANQQKVELVTLVQDAVFLFPEKFEDGTTESLPLGTNDDTGEETRIKGFYLNEDELHFTDKKPYVIYGYAAVPSGETLTIDAGVRVYFHAESGIIVAKNASLHVNGKPSSDLEHMENEVIFRGDRLAPEFSTIPGQWGTIWLTVGSTDHHLNHVTIKNATVGILMDSNDGGSTPTLTLRNTQIYNSANMGLWAKTGHVYGENVVINNSGQASLNLSLGGKYTFVHCTFANYWSNGYRQFPAVLIQNVLETSTEIFVADLGKANFTNCIIYGNEEIELLFNSSEKASFNYAFKNCLIHFNDINKTFTAFPEYDFSNPVRFKNVILNQPPTFRAPTNNNLKIGEESAANGAAIPGLVPKDILGVSRNKNPDLGAYESIDFIKK